MVQKLKTSSAGKDTQFIVNTVLTTAVAIVTIMVTLILYIDQQSREDIRLMIKRNDEQEQKFKAEC